MSKFLKSRKIEFGELTRMLGEYEHKYGLSTIEFFRRYSAGELGDDNDLMMWAGIYHLYLTSHPIRRFIAGYFLITQLKPIIHRALDEDIGDGDVTTLCTIPPEVMLKGEFIAKEAGVIAGLEVARLTFTLLDERVQFTAYVADGDRVEARQVFAEVQGPGRALLSGERVALNFLQRMSGIATLTRRLVEAVKGTSAVILDTRKTAPGLRLLDKWAVRLGGGQNHRFGLYDMVLIKDNHIAVVGSIAETVARVRGCDARKRAIEVEVTTLDELREALKLNVDRILLDNMSLAEMREAVRITGGRTPLEASGNVTLENVGAIAATGVDYISTGMLTHSVRALDISLSLSTGS